VVDMRCDPSRCAKGSRHDGRISPAEDTANRVRPHR
jgi:hypothetical protein